MSLFSQEFSARMCPSDDLQTVSQFQRAHELVHGLITSKGHLTAENVVGAVRECFAEVQKSFTVETKTVHERAVHQFVSKARAELGQLQKEIGSIEESVAPIIEEGRPRESDQEEPPKTKRAKVESGASSVQESIPQEIYEELITRLSPN